MFSVEPTKGDLQGRGHGSRQPWGSRSAAVRERIAWSGGSRLGRSPSCRIETGRGNTPPCRRLWNPCAVLGLLGGAGQGARHHPRSGPIVLTRPGARARLANSALQAGKSPKVGLAAAGGAMWRKA